MALPSTAPREPDPLRSNVPIVNADGTPNAFFIRQWLQQRGLNNVTPEVITSIQTILSRQISAGAGLQGGGTLGAGDITLALGAVLDDLNDVDTASVPPTDGQALAFNTASGLWKPTTIVGSGGLTQPQVLARISIGV